MTAGRADRAGTLIDLTAEARYARHRYDLYQAKVYSGRPTSSKRLHELQRACESAERRLAIARERRRP